MPYDNIKIFDQDDLEAFKIKTRFLDIYRMKPFVYISIKYCSADIIDYLIDTGHLDFDKPDGAGLLPIQVAAYSNDPGRALDILIERGADIDAQNRDGDTALHTSARHTDPGACQALLERGASPWIHNAHGDLPRDLALGRSLAMIERAMLSGTLTSADVDGHDALAL